MTEAQHMARLCGPDVAVAMAQAGAGDQLLRPVEAAAIARAVAPRKAEFAAGRSAARSAMSQFGLAPAAIAMQPDRSPDWPQGLAGSITHDQGLCLAAVAQTKSCRAVGIDIEPLAEFDSETAQTVAPELPTDAAPHDAAIVFSIKEAVYKAQYPLSQEVLNFDALEVVLDKKHAKFAARFCQSAGPISAGTLWHGRYECVAGRVFSAMIVPA
ncbi:MAG: 4'-phosphopantetheinyl transferase superfamily protein [Rhodobacteraceae bacterium]|nr:4'-phosphopantetheinyl transferase superfamily protein [Paracoccaceae bacterium]